MSVANILLDNLKNYYIERNQNLNMDPKFKNYVLESSRYKIENYKSDNPHILGRCKVILSVLDAPTQNGTYYSLKWAEKTLINNEKFQSKLKKKLILGETDHPDKADGSIKNVSHSVIEIYIEGKEVWGVVEVFNTPNGNILWTLLNAGVVLGVSSRGIGDEYYDGGVKKIKEDNFEMIGWDFVIDASALGAEFKEFTESKRKEYMNKLSTIKESYNNNYSKYIVENLIREDKINENLKKFTEEKEILTNELEKHKFYAQKLIINNDNLKIENNKLKRKLDIYQENIRELSKNKEGRLISEKRNITEATILTEKIKLLEEELENEKMVSEKYKKEALNKKPSESKIEILLSERKKVTESANKTGVTNSIKSRIPKYND